MESFGRILQGLQFLFRITQSLQDFDHGLTRSLAAAFWQHGKLSFTNHREHEFESQKVSILYKPKSNHSVFPLTKQPGLQRQKVLMLSRILVVQISLLYLLSLNLRFQLSLVCQFLLVCLSNFTVVILLSFVILLVVLGEYKSMFISHHVKP